MSECEFPLCFWLLRVLYSHSNQLSAFTNKLLLNSSFLLVCHSVSVPGKQVMVYYLSLSFWVGWLPFDRLKYSYDFAVLFLGLRVVCSFQFSVS